MLPITERRRIKTWIAVASASSTTPLRLGVGEAGASATGSAGSPDSEGGDGGGVEDGADGPSPVHVTTQRSIAHRDQSITIYSRFSRCY